jgi:membrane-bound lytic murein transglycosylase D
MKFKFNLLIYIFLLSTTLFAQIENDSIDKIKIIPKLSVLDSLKLTFVHHTEMAHVDNLWMKELSNTELSDTQFEDILNINPDQNVAFDLPTDILKERLAKLDAKSPFNIEYNIGLENVIKSLLKNRKKSYERLLAISQYYFPLFEEALSKYNIPIEVKYLAIVESALNPKAKSRVGATGLWQFMYNTGLQYKLDVNSYVDERSDPIKATEAACQYLSGMYKIFGDWDLVLASYNCGPGNVTKAIRRSNGQTNYWNIRKNLPRETAGYLPAFLATMYIMEYHNEHGINKLKAPVNYFATDTIAIKKQLSFKQISKLIDIPETELQFFNPSYKLDIVPAANKKNFLRLPQEKIAIFTSNEDKIYFYANYETNLREKPNATPIVVKDTLNYYTNERKFVTKNKSYKVKRGDNLGEIASKFGVTISDIKKWNRLTSNNAPRGKVLKLEVTESVLVKVKHAIKKDENIAVANNPEKTNLPITETIESKKDSIVSKIVLTEKVIEQPIIKNFEKTTLPEKVIEQPIVIKNTEKIVIAKTETKPVKEKPVFKEEKVVTFKDVTKTYKVKKGDNLSSIADDLGVTIADLKSWNKIRNNTVNKGSNLKYTTSQRTVATIKKRIGTAADFEENNDAKQNKSDKTNKPETDVLFQEHIVVKGDNLKNIASKNHISINDLKEWNNLKTNNVALGTKLIIAKPQVEVDNNKYTVATGDNIWTIAEKFKVTAIDLKQWNNLKSNNLKNGQTLVISDVKSLDNEKSKNNNKKIADNLEREKLYLVKKGDSLFSISQKYPGVTVSDLKKWNDIQDGTIKPGMKLKIII